MDYGALPATTVPPRKNGERGSASRRCAVGTALLIHGVNRHFVWRAALQPLLGDGQEKGKKKATDGRHDGKNPDVFNGPLH